MQATPLRAREKTPRAFRYDNIRGPLYFSFCSLHDWQVVVQFSVTYFSRDTLAKLKRAYPHRKSDCI